MAVWALTIGLVLHACCVGAQQTGVCVGDCDVDGEVTVDELIKAVNIALNAALLSTCQAADADGNGEITIDEILLAVNRAQQGCPTPTPTIPPTVTPDINGTELVQASARVAVQTVKSISIIDFGFVSANAGKAASPIQPHGRFLLAANARVGIMSATRDAQSTQPCPGGGNVDVSACASGATSTQTVTYRNCVTTTASQHIVTRNGVVSQTVEGPDFCATGQVGAHASTLELNGFEQTETDSQNTVVAHVSATLTDAFAPTQASCASGEDGTETIDGSYALTCMPTAESLTCTRPADTTLTANHLVLNRTSGGFPCEMGVTANGTLAIDDRIESERFTQTFRSFFITETKPDADTNLFTENGPMTVDCLGDLNFSTNKKEDALSFVAAGTCPVSGELEVNRPIAGAGATLARLSVLRGEAAAVDGLAGDSTVAATGYRDQLFRATNGEVYQVLQNASSDQDLGADAIQITTVVGAAAQSVGECANAAGASSKAEAVVGAEKDAWPPSAVFKSGRIPDASVPCFNRNGNGGDGQVCIGPGCAPDCQCGDASHCATFTLGTDRVSLIESTSDIPSASLVESLAPLGPPCNGFAGRATYAFGTVTPTIETRQCLPAPRDGFQLPDSDSAFGTGGTRGTTVIFIYDTPLVSLFNAGSAGFPIDLDGSNRIGCQGTNLVLHLGHAVLNSVPAPRIIFTPTGGVAFDFDGDNMIDKTELTCHTSALSQCQPPAGND